MKILFLHHSTGRIIWEAGVKKWFKDYNKKKGTRYDINERDFPAESPYGWNNYPYDYWNIWVRNAADNAFKKEPTLEMLTKKYDMIIFKHCFPGSDIKADIGKPEIESDDKRIENYVLQYNALKQKMHEFPDVKFLVWTGAALVRGATDEERAARAKSFSEWVRSEWDEPGDNIFVWDFFNLETGGGLYLKDEYAKSPANSHPNEEFANTAAPLFCERIVNVLEGRGDQR
ncbi:MAG: hypothetical protein GTO51_06740 [Candidatus Latescibacteria bacterium]|nr:hypothetical protein [Candidatus Latescibacterota bacterium]NIM21500.1 hypothetical protein [Candidatus Latescibacterota bacterium]NIM65671.1 hypothetical protein [Candidatus Latescibacterota bacterium]NIO02053.1 hypothetical protein [Candidatus Latescibacterota bacterium]NIO28865.1 hypothetical protein [Candidatus Latescibacterota bacterium]